MSARNDQMIHAIGVHRTYAAAHTLASPDLSDEENRRVYGKCAHPHGHGHDYRFEFVVNARTLTDGVVMPRAELLASIDRYVTPQFDCQNLNETVGRDAVTSGENLVKIAWELLAPHLPPQTTLQVHLQETRKNSFCYPPE